MPHPYSLVGTKDKAISAIGPMLYPYSPLGTKDKAISAIVLGFVLAFLGLVFAFISSRTVSTEGASILSYFALTLMLLGLASVIGGEITLRRTRSKGYEEEIPQAADELIEELHGGKLCERCGNPILPLDSYFCSNCGAAVPSGAEDHLLPSRQEIVALVADQSVEGKGRHVCMICNLSLKSSDLRAWCSHCGNAFHRTHLLEWVHKRKYCPVCQARLDEKELKKQLSRAHKTPERRVKRKGGNYRWVS